MVFPCTKSLSKLSIDQTLKLKELESNYERVLDKNCRVFAGHFKRVLERKDDGGSTANPKVRLLDKKEKWKEMEEITEEKFRTEQLSLPNGRYNVILIAVLYHLFLFKLLKKFHFSLFRKKKKFHFGNLFFYGCLCKHFFF